jgi:hypothetical protein
MSSWPPQVTAQLIVRIDAVFEATLGGLLVVLALRSPRDGAWRLPTYLKSAELAGLALGLGAVAIVLWLLSRRLVPRLLIRLAAANAVTGLAAVWYAFTVNAGAAVRALVTATGLALVGLAVVQVTTARYGHLPADDVAVSDGA